MISYIGLSEFIYNVSKVGYSIYEFNPFFIPMITVFNFLHKYCELRELPPPTKEDLESCGRLISHHFKYYWAISEYEGLVQDCGFIVSLEGDKKVVVQAYPDVFKNEMANRVDIFFLKKFTQKTLPEKPVVEQISEPELPKKKRKRIPAKPSKEFSVKPSKVEGQIQGQ